MAAVVAIVAVGVVAAQQTEKPAEKPAFTGKPGSTYESDPGSYVEEPTGNMGKDAPGINLPGEPGYKPEPESAPAPKAAPASGPALPRREPGYEYPQ